MGKIRKRKYFLKYAAGNSKSTGNSNHSMRKLKTKYCSLFNKEHLKKKFFKLDKNWSTT